MGDVVAACESSGVIADCAEPVKRVLLLVWSHEELGHVEGFYAELGCGRTVCEEPL
jgi:hypothetical protein